MDLKSLIEQKIIKWARPFLSGDTAVARPAPPLVPIARIACTAAADNIDITLNFNGTVNSGTGWTTTVALQRLYDQFQRAKNRSFTNTTPDPDVTEAVSGMAQPLLPDVVLTQFVQPTPDAITHGITVKSVTIVEAAASGAGVVPVPGYLQIVLHLTNEGTGTYTGDILVYAA
ncbi:MAG: hypothetical protein IT340_20065 [Chloroflexi bacterium]|nr:hypothetical protein [Chloroflexota bacterium]